MKKTLILALTAGAVSISGCFQQSPTAPRTHELNGKSAREETPGPDGTCETGWILASGATGVPICVPDDSQ